MTGRSRLPPHIIKRDDDGAVSVLPPFALLSWPSCFIFVYVDLWLLEEAHVRAFSIGNRFHGF